MSENELQLLGFKKQVEESEPSYYYYTYDVANGLSFITNSSDESTDGKWHAEFYDTEPAIVFTNFEELQLMINLLNRRKIIS